MVQAKAVINFLEQQFLSVVIEQFAKAVIVIMHREMYPHVAKYTATQNFEMIMNVKSQVQTAARMTNDKGQSCAIDSRFRMGPSILIRDRTAKVYHINLCHFQ